MQKVAICKFCGAAFLQRNRKQVTCSLPCRRKLEYKLDRELPKSEVKTLPPSNKKSKPKKPPIETMEACRYEDCRYRGKIGPYECCDYCFITGDPRGCKISECTHALEDGETREAIIKKMKQKGIF